MNKKYNGQQDLGWLSTPEVYRVNRIDAHSDHDFYETESEYNEQQTNLKKCLNGMWDFAFAKNPAERNQEFYKEGASLEGFQKIKVPGHIQMQGYDQIKYVNTMYPWDGQEEMRPPQVSADYNPVGSYVTFFDLNKEQIGKQTFISFQGVETAFYVWLNGEFIGYATDTFTPSEFDISAVVKESGNKLAVEVYKRSSASWIEDQDFWRFSGIFRDVYIYAVPKAHVFDMDIKSNFDYKKSTAFLNLSAKILGDIDYKGKVILTTPNGEKVNIWEGAVKDKIDFSAKLENILPWSAEIPNMYEAAIYLLDENKNIIEIATTRYGFRKFELIDKVMCINGKRIVFKGINRHEFSADKGRAITDKEMLFDIKFMKQNNINAVRTCHYPNQSLWYKLCDEYGIYLIDETNLESHGSWQKLGKVEPSWNIPGDNMEWLGTILDRAESMYERDKNHPSILMWSLGNESYAGKVLEKASQYFHKKDSTRLVHYEGVVWNREYDHITDMESRMYAKPNDVVEYLENNPKKPYINCEYMHAMGNSLGGMKLYTDLEDKYELYQGGFIWDYIDQAIEVIEDGKKVLKYGGDFDDRATDYCFCTDGIIYADRTISPKVAEVKYLYQNIKMELDKNGIIIKNDNCFINTEKYEFKLIVLGDNERVCCKKYSFNVPPQSQKHFDLELQDIEGLTNSKYITYNVIIELKDDEKWATKGFNIAMEQKVFERDTNSLNDEENDKEVPENKKLTVIHGDVNIGVRGADFLAMFSISEGGLTSLTHNGNEFIVRTPKPIFTRAYTDNDLGAGVDFNYAMWNTAGKAAKLYDMKMNEEPDNVKVSFYYNLPITGYKATIEYTVHSTGIIDVCFEVEGTEEFTIPLYGMEFKLPKKYHHLTYFGNGPYENYNDRNNGSKLGLYSLSTFDNMSRYLIPQECGNRTGVKYIDIKDENGYGLRFSKCDKDFECSALPYSTAEIENAMHIEELPQCSYTWVRIIGEQMGVGGDDSWGAPVHDEFLIEKRRKHTFAYSISFVK